MIRLKQINEQISKDSNIDPEKISWIDGDSLQSAEHFHDLPCDYYKKNEEQKIYSWL